MIYIQPQLDRIFCNYYMQPRRYWAIKLSGLQPGMGIRVPNRRVLFNSSLKYDGFEPFALPA